MANLGVVIAATALLIAAGAFLGWAGFRNGDYTGEALARALRKELEEAAAKGDRIPPHR